MLGDPTRLVRLDAADGGYHEATVGGLGPGARYRLVLDDGRELADPVSRAQPDGVSGPSEVFDPLAHRWGDGGFVSRPLWQHVIYEAHIGTLTPAGTFDSAIDVLDELAELGITAVEPLPVAQFSGTRNWGYDGVFPYAVQHSYGGPAAFQRFVDAAHQRGMAVVLDVVYNHLGPEGNVLDAFGPYFTDRYRTPWGPAINFDGPGSDQVRRYFVENALTWFRDFHVDALRLDAVHGIVDPTANPFLSELAGAAEQLGTVLGHRFDLIAESADNDPRVVSPTAVGGLGLDAQWNDDFHHALHAALTGERQGYYADFGDLGQLARSMSEGFVFQGEYSATAPGATAPARRGSRRNGSCSLPRTTITSATGPGVIACRPSSGPTPSGWLRPCSCCPRGCLCCSWGRSTGRPRRSPTSSTMPTPSCARRCAEAGGRRWPDWAGPTSPWTPWPRTPSGRRYWTSRSGRLREGPSCGPSISR